MNRDQDNNLPSDGSDPLVSATYRAMANERTPAALDATVLRQARAATSRLQRFTEIWFRPLAFVATLALSLALVLELTSTPELQSPGIPDSGVGRREAEPFEADPHVGTSEFRKAADAPAEMKPLPEPAVPAEAIGSNVGAGRGQKPVSTPDALNVPDIREEVSADFADMIESGSKQMPDADSVTVDAIYGKKAPRSNEEVRTEGVVPYGESAASVDVQPRPCDAEQTADAEGWWQCIADLEDAGRRDEASAELELFNEAYPDFEPPAALPSK
jgi:hypothetical protein